MIKLAEKRDQMLQWSRLHWPWILLVLFSILVHFWGLDLRSFHHDEAIHAKLSWDLAERGIYRYDPTYHGPLLYYLTALSYHIFGDSDWSARLPIALAGIAMVFVAWRMREPFGERSAWWAGLLFTISPMFLFFGRFLRMDLLEAALASGVLLAWWAILHDRPHSWVWLGIWTGLAFATKENAYVTACLIAACAILLALDRGFKTAVPIGFNFLRDRWVGLATSLAVFVLVTVPIYTVGFSFPGDWMFPVKAISYWWGQHSVARVGGPWWFHLPRLLQYEFLVLGAATVWIVRRWSKLKQYELFLYTLGIFSIMMYIYLGEKVPWLGVHQVWPFVPLAGAQLAYTMGPQGRWWSRTVAIVGLSLTVFVSFVANFVLDEITPNQERVESLHYVQTSPELTAVMREGIELFGGQDTTMAAVSGEATWPVTWYWRNESVWWGAPKMGVRPPLVLCDPEKESEIRRTLGEGYVSDEIPLRSWFLMYFGDPGPMDFLRYFFTRLPWTPVGSTNVVVFRKTGGDVAASHEAGPPPALAEALGVTTGEVIGEGWFSEIRGVAFDGERIAVADAGVSKVKIFGPGEDFVEVRVEGGLIEAEAVAWFDETSIVIADTWQHRVVHVDIEAGRTTVLEAPDEGWYGPRAIAVAADGRIAVADTGHKRIVVYSSGLKFDRTLTGGQEGALDEPGGLAWLSDGSIVVCDTGHHRILELTIEDEVESEVALEEAWSDYYSRPQLTIIDDETWLVSDTPARSLWLVSPDGVKELEVGDFMIPSGLAWSGTVLVVGDLEGRLWRLEINDGG